MLKEKIETLGINFELFEKLYNELVNEAVYEMRVNGIRNESESDLRELYVQIGIYEGELVGRCVWKEKNSAEEEKYFKGDLVDIVDRGSYRAAVAGDLLYEDEYFNETGEISEEIVDWFWREYGEECLTSINDIEQVIEELVRVVEMRMI